jgi:hypothetical protein
MMLDEPRVSRIAFRDGGDRSGIVIRDDGRLCVIDRGVGLSVQLDPERLRGIGRQCIATAAILEERQRAIATEAADGLQRALSRAGSPSADDDDG